MIASHNSTAPFSRALRDNLKLLKRHQIRSPAPENPINESTASLILVCALFKLKVHPPPPPSLPTLIDFRS